MPNIEEREIVPTEVTKMVVDDYLYISCQLIELDHDDIMNILEFVLDISVPVIEAKEGETL